MVMMMMMPTRWLRGGRMTQLSPPPSPFLEVNSHLFFFFFLSSSFFPFQVSIFKQTTKQGNTQIQSPAQVTASLASSCWAVWAYLQEEIIIPITLHTTTPPPVQLPTRVYTATTQQHSSKKVKTQNKITTTITAHMRP